MRVLCSPLSSRLPLRLFITTASFLETSRTLSRFSVIYAYPENRTSRFLSPCEKPIFFQFSLWSHLILRSSLDQVLDRLVSASFYVTAFTPLTYLLVVFQGSYFFRMGYLFLRWASRLDAFSVYPLRISLPSCALGRTTVAPVMRSLRSSRTRSNSSHVSFAHDG